MPGSWVNIPTQVGDTEQLSFHLDSLASDTEYDIEFSTDAAFDEEHTTSAQFRTLQSVDRTLSAVTVNGEDLVGWNYVTDNEFSTTVTFSAFTGTVTVSALATHTSATAVVTPVITTDARHADSIEVTITVTNGGADRVYTLTVNVVAYRLGNFSIRSNPRGITYAPQENTFFTIKVNAGPDAYVDGVRVHEVSNLNAGRYPAWDGSKLWMAGSGSRRAWPVPYSPDSGFGVVGTSIALVDLVTPRGAVVVGDKLRVMSYSYNGNRDTVLAYTIGSDGSLTRSASDDVLLAGPLIPGYAVQVYGLGWYDDKWWGLHGRVTPFGSSTVLAPARVVAWTADGARSATDDWLLHSANTQPAGICNAGPTQQNGFWVTDSQDNIAYAYSSSGEYIGVSG